MRRLHALLILLVVLAAASAALAQTAVPTATPLLPPTDTPAPFVSQSAAPGDDAAARALEAAERAERAAADASGFLGIFEGIGLVISGIGALIAVLIGVGGIIGFGNFRSALERVRSAEDELGAARARFEEEVLNKQKELNAMRAEVEQARAMFEVEMRQKQMELDALVQQQLERSAQQQRAEAERAVMALSLLPMGERQYHAQNLTGARDTYLRALAMDERNPLTHYRLGYVCTQLGELEEAERHLNRALELDPALVQAVAALGYVYRRMAEETEGAERNRLYARAEESLLKALSLSPRLVDDDGESWWGSLGGLYRRRGQIDEAIRAYESGAQVTSHSSYPLNQLALLRLSKGGDLEAVLATFQRVERLAHREVLADTGDYWAYSDLLMARLALGRDDAGVDEALESVLESTPADAEYALETLLHTLRRMRGMLGAGRQAQIDRAIARLENAIGR